MHKDHPGQNKEGRERQWGVHKKGPCFGEDRVKAPQPSPPPSGERFPPFSQKSTKRHDKEMPEQTPLSKDFEQKHEVIQKKQKKKNNGKMKMERGA